MWGGGGGVNDPQTRQDEYFCALISNLDMELLVTWTWNFQRWHGT